MRFGSVRLTVGAGALDHVEQRRVEVDVLEHGARELGAAVEPLDLLLQRRVEHDGGLVVQRHAVPFEPAGVGPLRWHAPDGRRAGDVDPPRALPVQLLDEVGGAPHDELDVGLEVVVPPERRREVGVGQVVGACDHHVDARRDDLAGTPRAGDALQLLLVLLEQIQLVVHGEHRLTTRMRQGNQKCGTRSCMQVRSFLERRVGLPRARR
jgi:hypothetical protein